MSTKSTDKTKVNMLSELAMANRTWTLHLKDRTAQKLHIAVYPNFFPVAYTEDGALAGFDIDFLVQFCEVVGLEPVFHKKEDFGKVWGISGEWRSNVDVACGGIGITSWRTTDAIEWSFPYFKVQRTLVYNKNDAVARLRDVTRRVYGTRGSTGFVDAEERLAEVDKGHLLVDRDSSEKEDVADLLSGKVQGLLRGSFVGRAIVQKHPKEFDMVEPWEMSHGLPVEGEVFAFPCRRGSGLAALLNVFTYAMERSGMLSKLARRHHMTAEQVKSLTTRMFRSSSSSISKSGRTVNRYNVL